MPGMVLASPILPRKSAAPAYVGNPYGISADQFENVAKNRLEFLGARAANDLTGSEMAATRTGDLGLVPASILTAPEHKKAEKDLASGGLLWTLVKGANDKERGGFVPNGAGDKAGAATLALLNPGTLGPSAVVVPKKLMLLEELRKDRTRARRRRDVDRHLHVARGGTSAFLQSGTSHKPYRYRADAERAESSELTDMGMDTDGRKSSDGYTEDGGLASDKCKFQCLHTTAWGETYEKSHPGGSSADGSPQDNIVASKSTVACGLQITEPRTDECEHCDSRTCIAKTALSCKTSASTTTCNSRWLYAESVGEFYDITGLVPGSNNMRFSASKKSVSLTTTLLETDSTNFPAASGNSEDGKDKKILPLWDPYWETHMPPLMASYTRNNRLLNYEGSALDYKYHPEHYGLGNSASGSGRGEDTERRRGSSFRRPRYTASDDRDW